MTSSLFVTTKKPITDALVKQILKAPKKLKHRQALLNSADDLPEYWLAINKHFEQKQFWTQEFQTANRKMSSQVEASYRELEPTASNEKVDKEVREAMLVVYGAMIDVIMPD